MGRQAPRLVLLPRQSAILERLARLRTVERRLAERVQVVLWSAEGKTTVEQAEALGVDPQRVGRWRHRWDEASEKLAAAEASVEADDKLEEMILEVLSDEERSGAPPKFVGLGSLRDATSNRTVPIPRARDQASRSGAIAVT